MLRIVTYLVTHFYDCKRKLERYPILRELLAYCGWGVGGRKAYKEIQHNVKSIKYLRNHQASSYSLDRIPACNWYHNKGTVAGKPVRWGGKQSM